MGKLGREVSCVWWVLPYGDADRVRALAKRVDECEDQRDRLLEVLEMAECYYCHCQVGTADGCPYCGRNRALIAEVKGAR